ncbi:MAG: hypothetical protein PQJ61_16645 [Spirochaetales bacterium]|uniref:Diaminopimelate epimerase n=1 Tax=Candidatus Thalassospirochaeta sargassi TaxID=3119039 RepID=A0AAJ1ML19_9SPIO|nr:hypothetical protein [Spirochaetales bacterium]
MDFDFYKLQSAGNDLILTNYAGKDFPPDTDLSAIGRYVCRRDYGIGGNGLIAVKMLSPDSIVASFIDPSGGFPSTTSDAALCLSRYVFDSGVAGKNDFILSINGNDHKIGIIDSNNFRLSLGIPQNDQGTELIERPNLDYIRTIQAGSKDYPVSVIHIQKTGVVVFTEVCDISNLKNKADEILKTAEIDSSQRLIFATVNSREELEVHIRNSRGDDFSSSCAIAAAASVVNGFLDRNASIIHKSGEYYFQWLQPSNEIFITGSSDYVYSGSMFIDFED